MTFSFDISMVTVTMGPYLDYQGQPIGGTVTFTPSVVVTHTASGTPLIPKPIPVRLNAGGMGTVAVPATDDARLSPVNFTYTVTYALDGALSPAARVVQLPASQAITDLDLLLPAEASSGATVYVPALTDLFVTRAEYVSSSGTGGSATTSATGLSSGILPPARIGDSSITVAKLAFDPATQVELDAASSANRVRANHVGVQPISSITGLAEALAAATATTSSGSSVADNADGTFTATGSSVIDGGDGTFTIA